MPAYFAMAAVFGLLALALSKRERVVQLLAGQTYRVRARVVPKLPPTMLALLGEAMKGAKNIQLSETEQASEITYLTTPPVDSHMIVGKPSEFPLNPAYTIENVRIEKA